VLPVTAADASQPDTITGAAAGLQGRAVSNAWELTPLVLPDPDGNRHSLYDWHGKVILLNFWATWCGPCQAEVPDLIRYQREYADQGLQVIGVGLDEVARVRNFIRTFRINYPVLVAEPARSQELLPRWGDHRQILPFTAVIGRDGHIHLLQAGPLDEEAFTDYVRPLLDAQAAMDSMTME
jgi:thiol-disulfide isomerase/thioredoxin